MTKWYSYRRVLKNTRKLKKPIGNLNKILRDMSTPEELIRGVDSSILEEYTACWPDKKGTRNSQQTRDQRLDDLATLRHTDYTPVEGENPTFTDEEMEEIRAAENLGVKPEEGPGDNIPF
jgi:hypothetical protein